MKKIFITLIHVLLFSCLYAQTNSKSSESKVHTSTPLVELASVNNSVVTDPRILKGPKIMSNSPIPKADPAREEMAKKKQPGTIKEFKKN
ncbi:MAG: hypothetical protein ABI402_06740 [Ferruginibacter sp.]